MASSEDGLPIDSCNKSTPPKDSLRPNPIIIRAIKIMYPKPPIWIKTSNTNWPKREKKLPVSTTIRPVPVIAEVEVKRASTKEMFSLPDIEIGFINKNVPSKIKSTKPKISTCIVVKPNFLFKVQSLTAFSITSIRIGYYTIFAIFGKWCVEVNCLLIFVKPFKQCGIKI